MDASPTIRELAPPRPAWPRRALDAIDALLRAVLVAAVAVMVAVVAAQVALRYGFNASIDWADEVSRLAFVWSIFLAIPLGVRQGSHIGIEIVAEKVPAALRAPLKRLLALASAVMMAAIAWYAGVVALEQHDELMATVDLSVSWFIVPVGIGAALSALHLAVEAAFGRRADQPRVSAE